MSMLHGRQRGKNRSLDGTIIRNESDNKLQEGTKLHELGKRFEADKAKLEKEITGYMVVYPRWRGEHPERWGKTP